MKSISNSITVDLDENLKKEEILTKLMIPHCNGGETVYEILYLFFQSNILRGMPFVPFLTKSASVEAFFEEGSAKR